MAIRKIVITNAATFAPSDPTAFNVQRTFRLRAPANRIIPAPHATSSVTDATEEEIAALRAGTYVEQSGISETFAVATDTAATVLAALETEYADDQAIADAQNPPVPLIHVSWDGLGWAQ